MGAGRRERSASAAGADASAQPTLSELPQTSTSNTPDSCQLNTKFSFRISQIHRCITALSNRRVCPYFTRPPTRPLLLLCVMSSSRGPSRHVSSSAVRQACDRCHGKKLRCMGGRSPCDRCLRDSTACVFSPAGKSGRPTKATKQQPAEASQQTSDGSKSTAETSTASHSSVNGLPNNLFDDLETIDISIHPQSQ